MVDRLLVLYPGAKSYRLAPGIDVVPAPVAARFVA
jgi:hypothetical protein